MCLRGLLRVPHLPVLEWIALQSCKSKGIGLFIADICGHEIRSVTATLIYGNGFFF